MISVFHPIFNYPIKYNIFLSLVILNLEEVYSKDFYSFFVLSGLLNVMFAGNVLQLLNVQLFIMLAVGTSFYNENGWFNLKCGRCQFNLGYVLEIN